MSFRSSITIVASPRPRVGKTLVARLLTDFHLSEKRKVVAFDLNAGERTLSQFLPQQTVAASVRDVNGQMALFDRLVTGDDMTKIIDLGHESYESFFTLAHQIDFTEEARQRSIAVAILFMVTPDQTSVAAYRNLRERFARAMLVPLHNEMLGSSQHGDKYPISGGGALAVRLPAVGRCRSQNLLWVQDCVKCSTTRHSHSQIRIWAMPRIFRLMRISSCSAGYVGFISNSASSICAFYWQI